MGDVPPNLPSSRNTSPPSLHLRCLGVKNMSRIWGRSCHYWDYKSGKRWICQAKGYPVSFTNPGSILPLCPPRV
ncbi:hypothetical protein RHMOL_Rhmol04G0367000 [Rhododendron molle]|uniref:Uncharacterized protein n=1 Tax=Rhododendron molle TaxID=49168 RepID=A0ACC0P8L2_RHOML|nr:hypothetical protein RHMOL_Rhmol04G0367000 [Rhododendron molle]